MKNPEKPNNIDPADIEDAHWALRQLPPEYQEILSQATPILLELLRQKKSADDIMGILTHNLPGFRDTFQAFIGT